MAANQPAPDDDYIVMTDVLSKKLLRNRKPRYQFDFQVPLARDEDLSRDWTPRAGDFALFFDGKGVICQQNFDGQRWQIVFSTSLTKVSVEEMVHTGVWELLEYDAELPVWYFRIPGGCAE